MEGTINCYQGVDDLQVAVTLAQKTVKDSAKTVLTGKWKGVIQSFRNHVNLGYRCLQLENKWSPLSEIVVIFVLHV